MLRELVFIHNNRPVTDSITVAEVFNKTHDNVIRDIRNQIEKLIAAGEIEFSLLNFEESTYKNERGRSYRKFLLTEEAFALITMAYVTVDAMRFKVRFINEFNQIKERLSKRNALMMPQTYADALRALADEVEEHEKTKHKLSLAEPKAQMYDVALSANNAQPMNAVAKTLGVGRNKLFEFLRNKKILRYNNEPYQEYLDRGYFIVRQVPIARSAGVINKQQTLVTAKGLDYIGKLLKRSGWLIKQIS